MLADIALLRAFRPAGAVQPAARWQFVQWFTQLWSQKAGNAYPTFAPRVLAFLDAQLNHADQLSLAQFSAYHLRDIISNLDTLTIARTTKLTVGKQPKAEDEIVECPTDAPQTSHAEFYGGEGVDAGEPEDEEAESSNISTPLVSFSLEQLTTLLTRRVEIEAATKRGRKKQADVQMKVFDNLFHTALNTPVPPNNVKLAETQVAYKRQSDVLYALDFQDAVMKHMLDNQKETADDPQNLDPANAVMLAVRHNLEQATPTRQWVDLADALQGPAHVAKLLITRCQEKLSKPDKPYKLNAEQLECIALYVSKLEPAFARRADLSQPWLHPAEVLLTIILDGGGGCGKTTLAVEVLLPLLEVFYGTRGVLRRAPANKPARLIGGRTMHSSQGLTPENSLRTHSLALNAQSRKKLATTHEDAGALHIDEYSMLQGELNNACALRTTYAREAKHKLNKNLYYMPKQRYGCMAVLGYSGDHLQLPPVPASSSMLAPLPGTSDEHKTGARIFRDAECVFQFQQAMRFTDDKQIAILESMRVPGGRRLSPALWQALQSTELSAAQPDVPTGWYHTCYCWSVTSMATFLVARQSAAEAKQTLFYVQAVDQPLSAAARTSQPDFLLELLRVPSLGTTKRLPGVALFHWNMRVRLSTTLQQPFAVQDVEGTVVGFDPDPADTSCKAALLHASQVSAEFRCSRMPKAIYVKLDECEHQFLPPGTCHTHGSTGHEATRSTVNLPAWADPTD